MKRAARCSTVPQCCARPVRRTRARAARQMEDERILPMMTLHRGRPRVSHELDSQRYCNAAVQCESRRLYGTTPGYWPLP